MCSASVWSGSAVLHVYFRSFPSELWRRSNRSTGNNSPLPQCEQRDQWAVASLNINMYVQHIKTSHRSTTETLCSTQEPKQPRIPHPLPVLSGSAVGKSKVIAGSHFGIFTKPARHCGGHTQDKLTVSSGPTTIYSRFYCLSYACRHINIFKVVLNINSHLVDTYHR